MKLVESFKDGYNTHKKASEVFRKYKAPCQEAKDELDRIGIDSEAWNRTMGHDMSIQGLFFWIGGFIHWLSTDERL